jgi:hypothetical protein
MKDSESSVRKMIFKKRKWRWFLEGLDADGKVVMDVPIYLANRPDLNFPVGWNKGDDFGEGKIFFTDMSEGHDDEQGTCIEGLDRVVSASLKLICDLVCIERWDLKNVKAFKLSDDPMIALRYCVGCADCCVSYESFSYRSSICLK